SSLFVSIRETVPSVWLVTTSVLPFSLTAQPRGSSPTVISLIARHPLPVRVTTETVPLSELVTYAFCPDTATQVGSRPTATSSAFSILPPPLPTSNTVTLFASKFTLNSRLPALFSAILLERVVVSADAGPPIAAWRSRATATAACKRPALIRISRSSFSVSHGPTVLVCLSGTLLLPRSSGVFRLRGLSADRPPPSGDSSRPGSKYGVASRFRRTGTTAVGPPTHIAPTGTSHNEYPAPAADCHRERRSRSTEKLHRHPGVTTRGGWCAFTE